MELNTKNIKRILFIILIGVIFFTGFQHLDVVLAAIKKVYSVFAPIITALCIAFVLNVLLTALETKVFFFMDKSSRKLVRKARRPLCVVLTYLLAIGILALLILVIIPQFVNTVTFLAEKMPGFVVDARNWAEGLLDKFNLSQTDLPDIKIDWKSAADTVKNMLSGSTGKIMDSAINITASVFSGMFDAIFSIVISIYLLAQKERIIAFVKRCINTLIPKKGTDVIYHISYQVYDSFSKFIGGQLLESLILGSLCFIGMVIFRFPNALLISGIVCVTSLVPIVGATISVIIGAMLILITSPIKALLFIVFFLVLQQVEGNLIYPKVVGRAVGLPGIVVVSAVLVGGNIGGIVGTLLAVPSAATLYVLFKELLLYVEAKRKKKKRKVRDLSATDKKPLQ